MFSLISGFAFDTVMLFKSDDSLTRKFRIYLAYLKLTLEYIFLYKLFGVRSSSENTLGFKIRFIDFQMFYNLFREIFLRKQYFFKATTPRPRILDCGGNIGIVTLFFKYYYPHSQIEVFEPGRKTFELLQKNVKSNHLGNVGLHNIALGGKLGKTTFYSSKEAETGGGGDTIVVEKGFKKEEFSAYAVHVAPLSGYIRQKIDFAKIDIEGAEHEVLEELSKGGKMRLINEMILEYHHHSRGASSKLAHFLGIFEKNGFEYLLNTRVLGCYVKGKAQNIMIYAYKGKN
ncbi:MAG: FkbM family methyltransferase [Candidatus Micrarchaeota archaeon]